MVGVNQADLSGSASFAAGVIKHRADAVDYADTDDAMAMDEDPVVAAPRALQPVVPVGIQVALSAAVERPITELFPTFRPNEIMKFSELVQASTNFRGRQAVPRSRVPRAKLEEAFRKLRQMDTLPDDRILFNQASSARPSMANNAYNNRSTFEEKEMSHGTLREEESGGFLLHEGMYTIAGATEPSFHPIEITNWEANIIWDDADVKKHISSFHRQFMYTPHFSITRNPVGLTSNVGVVPNYEVEMGEWEENIIWDEEDAERMLPITTQISLNDPFLAVENMADTNYNKNRRRGPNGQYQNRYNDSAFSKMSTIDRFNISNDQYYNTEWANRFGRVRQTFNKNSVQHTVPALRMQLPFFKRFMSKSDLRYIHRPQLKIGGGDVWKFTRVKNLKKKRSKVGRSATEFISSVRDLTLKDNANFLLWEYSEEYPVIMSNGGMGSLLSNYYRKKDEKDMFLPKYPEGGNVVLEQVDTSPFFNFGEIKPGESYQVIKNNLFIAPTFPHEAKERDFLLIRSTLKDNTKKHFLRTISKLYLVGQQFPLAEIPPPQSRKITTYIRDRLKTSAFRHFRRNTRLSRYPLSKMINIYQRYHDQSLRKHMKDMCDLQRSSKNNSWWLTLKKNVVIPTEAEMIKMVQPEMACVFESIRVGQQRLADAGYGTGEIDGEEEVEDETGLDDEIQLSPWNISKNFTLATQGKGMVKLYGPGDPSGCGEAFSFFTASMKEMFYTLGSSPADLEAYQESIKYTGHRFIIADQQKVYRAEMSRIWDTQIASLASTEEPEYIDDDDDSVAARSKAQMEPDEDTQDVQEMMMMISSMERSGAPNTSSPALPMQTAPPPMSRHANLSQMSIDEMNMDTGSIASSRHLRTKSLLVRRKILNDVTGQEEWHEEVILDHRITNAYLKQRRIMELGSGGNAIKLDDDEETRKKKLQLELKQLRREVGRPAPVAPAQIRVGPDGQSRLGTSERACRSCGQKGHITTNRICPNFAQNYPERARRESAAQIVKSENGKLKISAAAMGKLEANDKKARILKLPTRIVEALGANAAPAPSSSNAPASEKPQQ